MKRILVIDYSQIGQTRAIRDAICEPLRAASDQIQMDYLTLEPEKSFPFPWPKVHFFEIFPETVQMKPVTLKAYGEALSPPYDLVILCYQVWFLSPSLPVSSFLQSPQACRLLKDTPVMTVISCRNMWLQAQEKVKALLENAGAHLVDNVVLTDRCTTAASFISTPLWMFTGRKKAWRWVPEAGIDPQAIKDCSHFGVAVRQHLTQSSEPIRAPMLAELHPCAVDEKLIASEKLGRRSFMLWSKVLSALGSQGSVGRRLGLLIYVVFLVVLILTLVPISMLIKKLFRPLISKKLRTAKAYYAHPYNVDDV